MMSLDNLKTTLNAIKCLLTDYPKKKDIPTKLPNPNPLNFTGAVTGSYDGSEALTVEISSGGDVSMTDDDILECLIGTDMLSAVKDADGAILTDETGKIILM